MRIDEIIESKARPVFSFEFFPPKTPEGEHNLREALSSLAPLAPDFASVTYGAGGSTQDRTLELTGELKRSTGIESMAHLTCVGASREDLTRVLDELVDEGVENVLALRGDPPRGQTDWTPHPDGLHFSSELVRLIAERHPQLAIGAACFPEVHPSAPDLASDLRYLKEKVDCGVDFLITQLFFEPEVYFDFVQAARDAGIEVPILPGVMPITDVAQIKTITGLCKATIPDPLLAQLDARADDPSAVLQFGVSYATLQCAELLARGAPGIHFITLNRSPATRAILAALRVSEPWRGREIVRSA